MSVYAKPEAPVLASDSQLATAGYYQLSWQPGIHGAPHKNISFELQQATSADFSQAEVIYRGQDMARVFSGMPDGEYFYRVGTIDEDSSISRWSQVINVSVKHHSLQKAVGFFIAGALVFLITLVFIFNRSRAVNKQ